MPRSKLSLVEERRSPSRDGQTKMPQHRVGLGTRFGRDGGCGWVFHFDFSFFSLFFFFCLQKSVHFFLSIFAFFPSFLPIYFIYFNHEPRGYEPGLLYIFHLIFF